MHRYTQAVKFFTLALILIFTTSHYNQGLIWDDKKANSKDIRKSLDLLNWEKLFNQKDINAQVVAFQ